MKTIPAIFEGGVFKPQLPVNLAPGARVEILLPDGDSDPVERLRARFPESFGVITDEDADEMLRAIEAEFGRIDPDAWR